MRFFATLRMTLAEGLRMTNNGVFQLTHLIVLIPGFCLLIPDHPFLIRAVAAHHREKCLK